MPEIEEVIFKTSVAMSNCDCENVRQSLSVCQSDFYYSQFTAAKRCSFEAAGPKLNAQVLVRMIHILKLGSLKINPFVENLKYKALYYHFTRYQIRETKCVIKMV